MEWNMESSTPVASRQPLSHRVSFAASMSPQPTPLRRKQQNLETDLLNESNDDLERAERRRSVALRRSINALPPAINTSSGPSTQNNSIEKLNENGLKSQLQMFFRLNSENKITVKNVWNIRVIDVLKELATKHTSDVLNLAANCLEVAGKVYGLRVDDLHTESLKLAGSLARNFAAKVQDDENGENPDHDVTMAERHTKKRQPKKKHVLIRTDKKHTVTADGKDLMGALPKLESAIFSAKTDTTLSATANLFTNTVRMDPGGFKFMLGSTEKAWNWTPESDPSVRPDFSEKQFPINLKPVDNYKLCAPFNNFDMNVCDLVREDREESMALADVVYDDDGNPIPEMDSSIHDIFEEIQHEELNDDDSVEEGIVAPLIHQQLDYIVDFMPTAQSFDSTRERSEYSFNYLIDTSAGKRDKIWAGPSHWKLKFIRRTQPVYTGQKEHDKTRKRIKRKKIEDTPVDLWKPLKEFTKLTKKAQKRKNGVLDAEKFTLPLLEPTCAKLIENIEYLMCLPSIKPIKKNSREVDYEVNEYNYNNPNDSNYCPQQLNDNEGVLNDDDFGNGDNCSVTSNSQEGGYVGNNLIDMPEEMVHETFIHYATKAKKLDMKKLKCAIWCTLTRTPEFDTSAKVTPIQFWKMYKELHIIFNSELNPPIAFTALLHLCNEQNLVLKKQYDILDFEVKGPKED